MACPPTRFQWLSVRTSQDYVNIQRVPAETLEKAVEDMAAIIARV